MNRPNAKLSRTEWQMNTPSAKLSRIEFLLAHRNGHDIPRQLELLCTALLDSLKAGAPCPDWADYPQARAYVAKRSATAGARQLARLSA